MDTELNLIVPIAADNPEYDYTIPYLFSSTEYGMPLCIKAIQGLDLKSFAHIYFVILKKHNERYSIDKQLQQQFIKMRLKKAHITILEHPTDSQAATIYKAIKKENIRGAIFIKDADGYFTCELTLCNGIVVYPLDNLPLVVPNNKSYVNIDDQFYITNIIEKKIISRYFNAGGYLFESSDEYCRYYEKLKDYSPLYLSHIVYCMLLEKKTFRPFKAAEYQDWGNEKLYKILGKQ